MTASLIERLEKAEAGSRELDRDVHSALFGTIWIPWRVGARKEWGFSDPDRTSVLVHGDHPVAFTTSLDDALALAERVLPGVMWWLNHQAVINGQKMYHAEVSPEAAEDGQEGCAATPALALCAAILKAKAMEESK